MLNLNDIIVAYLRENRRLVVPEFGAFIAKESGEVIFSELLRGDDGVLSSLLASHGLNPMEITIAIDRYKFEVRHALQEFGYCQLGALGTLRLEPESKTIKLYQVEMAKGEPAIEVEQKPIAEAMAAPKAEPKVAVAPKIEVDSKPTIEATTATTVAPKIEEKVEKRPQHNKYTPKRRRGVDTIMVIAIVILLGALATIAYGYYVSTYMTESDDAQIEALRNEIRDEANRE